MFPRMFPPLRLRFLIGFSALAIWKPQDFPDSPKSTTLRWRMWNHLRHRQSPKAICDGGGPNRWAGNLRAAKVWELQEHRRIGRKKRTDIKCIVSTYTNVYVYTCLWCIYAYIWWLQDKLAKMHLITCNESNACGPCIFSRWFEVMPLHASPPSPWKGSTPLACGLVIWRSSTAFCTWRWTWRKTCTLPFSHLNLIFLPLSRC